MTMEEVVVRLKPLDDILHEGVIAGAWIGKPPPMDSAAGPLVGLGGGGSDEDEDHTSLFAAHRWDCDGCPPPYFDLPPPPRPPFLDDADYCGENGGGGGSSPYESCDNGYPVIIDSQLHLENDLLNLLVIVISALVLVLLVMLVACVIWRKRVRLFDSLALRGKTPRSPTTLPHPNQNDFVGQGYQTSLRPKAGAANASMELSEHPGSRHVYNNPNYPTMEIGGLPFYLVPSNAAAVKALSNSPPGEMLDTSLTTTLHQQPDGQRLPSRLAQAHIYEPGYVSSSSVRSGGPIYEDIDRMCTYRGSPPELASQNMTTSSGTPQQATSTSSSASTKPDTTQLGGDDRTYYNVFPHKQPRGFSRPDSGGSASSPLPCGTSSSEVSFESGSSPRHVLEHPQRNGGGNVIVNPLMSNSPLHRNRALSPTSRGSTNPSSPSVYYYADTLRPRQNRAFVDSDSGISNNPDTPPQLPSSRLAALANASQTLEGQRGKRGGSSRRKGSTSTTARL